MWDCKWGVGSTVYLCLFWVHHPKLRLVGFYPLILRLSRYNTHINLPKIDHHNQQQRQTFCSAAAKFKLKAVPRRMFDSSVRSLSNKGQWNIPSPSRQHLRFPTRHHLTVFHCACELSITPSRRTSFSLSFWIHYSAVVASKQGNSEFPSGNCLPSSGSAFPTSVSSLSLSPPPLLLPLLLHHQPFFPFFMLHLFPLVLLYLPQSASYKYGRFALSLLSHLPPILSSSSFPSMPGILIISSILTIFLIVSLTQLSFISTISYSPLKAGYSQH